MYLDMGKLNHDGVGGGHTIACNRQHFCYLDLLSRNFNETKYAFILSKNAFS